MFVSCVEPTVEIVVVACWGTVDGEGAVDVATVCTGDAACAGTAAWIDAEVCVVGVAALDA
jgi:hypothetical protein